MELLFVLLQSHLLFDSPQDQGLKSPEDRVTTCDFSWKADMPTEGNHLEL